MDDKQNEEHIGCCCSCGSNDRMTARDQKLRNSLLTRLNRIEGQVRGIKGMIERDCYCDDVLQQVSAVQSALNAVSKMVLKSHIQGCVTGKLMSGDTEIIDELVTTIGKML